MPQEAPADTTAGDAAPVAPVESGVTDARPGETDEEPEDQCVFGDICLGPVLTLGLANPLGIGIHARIHEQFGVGLDYQFLPSISFGDASAGISLFTLDGRWYPGGSNFFLSAGFAYQSFYADAATTVSTPAGDERISVEGSIGVPAFKLGLGVMGGDGFVMGIDLGLAIPLGSADVEFESDLGGSSDPDAIMQEAQFREDINDAADTVVNALPVLFQLNLIRIGYMF